jgi:hypothetical protein
MDLTVGSRSWLRYRLNAPVTARGRLAPRLLIPLIMSTPTERITAELRHARVQVFYADELIGATTVIGEQVTNHETSLYLDVPTSHAALHHITTHLAQSASFDLTLTWYGLLAVVWQPTPAETRFQGDPEPGEETLLHLPPHQAGHTIQIPRSDWYERVLAPTSSLSYLFLEVAVPQAEIGKSWTQAYNLLANAEKAFAVGDDPSVFVHLRGALDALPGAKQEILNGLPERQRRQLDPLVKSMGAYLHSGRHVSDTGDDQGTFPVDHQDASFAINMMKTTLAHISQVLAAASAR